jgi:hypothetical protein
LRRNKEKYFSWNHETKFNKNEEKVSKYALTNNNDTNSNNLNKDNSNNNKNDNEITKKKILLKKENENNFSTKEINNTNNPNYNKIDLNLNLNKKSTENLESDNIINNDNTEFINSDNKIENFRNINLGNLKQTYNQYNQNNDFKIKKIIRKENNNIDKFIRISEDVLLKDEKIFGEQIVNKSEYNQENRLFKNENLAKNNVYYYKYSKDEKSDGLRGNNNIIYKGIN